MASHSILRFPFVAGIVFCAVLSAACGFASGVSPPESTAKDAPNPTLADSARKIVAAIVEAARRNARGATPRTGDDLTALYLREAAAAAKKLPADQAAGALLLALGIALDDSTILRSNPLAAALCRRIESDDERKARLAVIGKPTLRGRRDWTQHFVVSCFLTEFVGPDLAESAGLLKEQLDMRPGGSGFSFADLGADLAGIAFAVRLKQGGLTLDRVATFAATDFLPKPDGLKEGLTREQFDRAYGSLSDPRFRTELDGIRQRVAELPPYRKVP
jgi:hypothetical protein